VPWLCGNMLGMNGLNIPAGPVFVLGGLGQSEGVAIRDVSGPDMDGGGAWAVVLPRGLLLYLRARTWVARYFDRPRWIINMMNGSNGDTSLVAVPYCYRRYSCPFLFLGSGFGGAKARGQYQVFPILMIYAFCLDGFRLCRRALVGPCHGRQTTRYLACAVAVLTSGWGLLACALMAIAFRMGRPGHDH